MTDQERAAYNYADAAFRDGRGLDDISLSLSNRFGSLGGDTLDTILSRVSISQAAVNDMDAAGTRSFGDLPGFGNFSGLIRVRYYYSGYGVNSNVRGSVDVIVDSSASVSAAYDLAYDHLQRAKAAGQSPDGKGGSGREDIPDTVTPIMVVDAANPWSTGKDTVVL